MRFKIPLSIFFTALLFSVSAQQLPFQGKLLSSSVPFTGSANFVFTIPSVSWTETLNAVSVQDGYYSVVLGAINPLPDSLFKASDQVSLNISVNGQALSAATLYSPISKVNYHSADLSFYGDNGQLNTVINDLSGNQGQLIMYNALGNEAVYLQGRDTGGRLQLSNPDATNSFNQATFFAGTNNNGQGAFMQLYGMNPAGNGQSLLVNTYNTAAGPPPASTPYSNGFRRGGIDIWDNEGRLLSFLSGERNETGTDPTGKSGYLGLNGTTTVNVMMGGKNWEDNNLGYLQIYGKNSNGSGWYHDNIFMDAVDNAGSSGGRITLANSIEAGSRTPTVIIESANGGVGGYLDLKDENGARRIRLAANGTISVDRASDGGSIANFFDGGAGDGGIAIQSATDINRLFFSANNADGVFTLRNTVGGTTVAMAANTGNVVVSGDVTANGVLLTSDRRFKENIKPLVGALSSTLALRGVNYYWKDKSKGVEEQIGLIAQEVEEILPQLVATNAEGFKAVNYAQLTAVLVEAIKELEFQVRTLNSKVLTLETENSELLEMKAEIEEMKKILGTSNTTRQ